MNWKNGRSKHRRGFGEILISDTEKRRRPKICGELRRYLRIIKKSRFDNKAKEAYEILTIPAL